jgi:glutamine---fructose-6-phosphate transaminase (isomerizing)
MPSPVDAYLEKIMCGIVGFTGRHQAAPILLDGLSKLEYRGYDSAGIAVRDGEKDIEIIKAKGRLKVLLEKTNAGESVPGMCGIGHTRWATHGEPSEVNAHPHVSDNGNVAAVHNGIIENYLRLCLLRLNGRLHLLHSQLSDPGRNIGISIHLFNNA